MNHRLFCFYGDDFTGSTDALEALAGNGVASVLFLDAPDERALAAYPACRAIGVAGESRSRDPRWMQAHLPGVFAALQAYGAPVCQYKVCSTFDSSPSVGSIGCALRIGQAAFATSWVPVVVAAPHLKRYVLFGNLFAAGAGAIHRIDRHPTMAHHPVTPMSESDLRIHLARQMDGPVALLDILALRSRDPEGALAARLAEHPRAVVFDGLDDDSLAVTGRLMQGRAFAVGSSGLTHALIRHWRQTGTIAPEFTPAIAGGTDRLIVVSGSCSPVTESQIRWALANGFEGLRVGASSEPAVEQAASVLAAGRSVVLYTALGPSDCQGGLRGEELGCYLGELLRDLVLRTGVKRVAIAGGDTSSHAARRLGVHALTFAALTTPGAPLCRCHSGTAALDGLEIVLKGGQVGPEDYFGKLKEGY
jgi:uncharacterized protein YgbK (DUF1537 family)